MALVIPAQAGTQDPGLAFKITKCAARDIFTWVLDSKVQNDKNFINFCKKSRIAGLPRSLSLPRNDKGVRAEKETSVSYKCKWLVQVESVGRMILMSRAAHNH